MNIFLNQYMPKNQTLKMNTLFLGYNDRPHVWGEKGAFSFGNLN